MIFLLTITISCIHTYIYIYIYIYIYKYINIYIYIYICVNMFTATTGVAMLSLAGLFAKNMNVLGSLMIRCLAIF